MAINISDMRATPVDWKDWEYATALVDASGTASMIHEWQIEDGRRPHARWSATAILVSMVVLVLEHKDVTQRNIMELLVLRFSNSQLQTLGCTKPKDMSRIALLRRVVCNDVDVVQALPSACEPGQISKADVDRVGHSVYEGVYAAIQRLLAPMDASHVSRRVSVTLAEIKQAEAKLSSPRRAALQKRADRAEQLANALIRASLTVLPDGHGGHIVLDLSVLPAVVQRVWAADIGQKKNSHPESSFYMRDRWHGAVFGWGATIVKSYPANNPNEVPLVLGLHFGEPNGGSTKAAVAAVLAALKSGALRKPGVGGPKVPLVITDMGYHADNFKPALEELGWKHFRNLTETERSIIRIPDSGMFIYLGMIFCEGALTVARAHRAIVGPTPKTDTRADGTERRRRLPKDQAKKADELLDQLIQLQMVDQGQPTRTVRRPQGRPRKGAVDTGMGEAWRLTKACPAVGCVACPLKQDNGEPKTITMPSPPAPGDQPRVCTKTFTTVYLDRRQLRHTQPVRRGTPGYDKWLKEGRAADERAHAFMKTNSGSGLRAEKVQARDQAFNHLATAIGLADVNRRIIAANYTRRTSIPGRAENSEAS